MEEYNKENDCPHIKRCGEYMQGDLVCNNYEDRKCKKGLDGEIVKGDVA